MTQLEERNRWRDRLDKVRAISEDIAEELLEAIKEENFPVDLLKSDITGFAKWYNQYFTLGRSSASPSIVREQPVEGLSGPGTGSHPAPMPIPKSKLV